jgi:hypothetical protein
MRDQNRIELLQPEPQRLLSKIGRRIHQHGPSGMFDND